MGSPDRRTALRAGLAAFGVAALPEGVCACSGSASHGARPVGAAADASGPAQSTAMGSPSPAASASRTAANSGPAASGATAAGASGTATSGAAAADAPELDHAASGRPQIALTFHGDGDPKLALALLKEAESHGAHLTVLAVGRWLGEHPELARRVLDGGHELGNHTESHADIATMSATAALAEITACAERLRKLTGSPGRWFRPSQTQHANPMLVEQARRAGYRTVLSYDVDPQDFRDPPPSAIADRLLAAAHPGAVVSLHLGHRGTVAALPAVLEGLKNRGLAAVTASELFS